ncbi:HPP family protein [Asticcacaulis solisilvae]|uniref:HPP family protein n=1 Tax=Asticcacaulis solisilvae TaxID=1217274 RepID=UPI003FD819C3
MLSLPKTLEAFYPRPMAVNFQERLRGAIGGALGVAFTAAVSLYMASLLHLSPWLVAPVGASAVLVYAVPSSPLAQPWSVVGGNTISAVMGLIALTLVHHQILTPALAVGLAIGGMFIGRCLHPPGGAMALLVVLTDSKDLVFAVFPAFTNSMLLVGFGLLYNNLTRRPYPHHILAAPKQPSGLLRVSEADFAEALARHNEVVDIDFEELNQIVRASELIAYRRMAGAMTCADLMTADPITVSFGTHLREAWQVMQRHDIKALPVIDRAQRVQGLLTHDDFDREAARLDPADPQAGLMRLLEPATTTHTDKPEAVGQIMDLVFATVAAAEPAEHLMQKFFQGDHRHVVVLDDKQKLAGIVSASDVMRTLFHKAA